MSMNDLYICKFSQNNTPKLKTVITFKFEVTQFSWSALKLQELR